MPIVWTPSIKCINFYGIDNLSMNCDNSLNSYGGTTTNWITTDITTRTQTPTAPSTPSSSCAWTFSIRGDDRYYVRHHMVVQQLW
jgi:hypothetical protein